jgi:hypothetical protein
MIVEQECATGRTFPVREADKERSAEYLDSDVMPRRGREPKVTCDQRCVEGFAQGDVYRVVCRQVMPQFPNARAKVMVRVSDDGQTRQIGYRLKSSGLVELTEEPISSKDVGDLNVQQMRRMQIPIPMAKP